MEREGLCPGSPIRRNLINWSYSAHPWRKSVTYKKLNEAAERHHKLINDSATTGDEQVRSKRGRMKASASDFPLPEEVHLETTTGPSRPVQWLDDVFFALDHSFYSVQEVSSGGPGGDTEDKYAKKDVVLDALYDECVSVALEFAWTGQVSLGGRPFKAWSALRPALQQLVVKARMECLASPSTSTSGDVVNCLMTRLS